MFADSGRIRLGVPAEFVDGSGNEWLVFDDNRIDLDQLAVIGRLAAKSRTLPSDAVDRDDRRPGRLRQETRAYVEANGVVYSDEIEIAEDADPISEILKAQNAPATRIRVSAGLPSGWTRKQREEDTP